MTRSSGSRGRTRADATALAVAAMIALLLAATTTARGQQTTERFIPIGRSPGLSHVFTYVGEITAVDPDARSLTMRRSDDAGTVTATVSDETRIWIDRSSIERPNLTGSFADLAAGRVAEIHFRDPERRRMADWIKVSSERSD